MEIEFLPAGGVKSRPMKSLIVRDFRRKFAGRLGSTSVTGFGIIGGVELVVCS